MRNISAKAEHNSISFRNEIIQKQNFDVWSCRQDAIKMKDIQSKRISSIFSLLRYIFPLQEGILYLTGIKINVQKSSKQNEFTQGEFINLQFKILKALLCLYIQKS